MPLTWTQLETKAQRLSKASDSGTLTQLKEDINIGYHQFNAKLGRYYSRKQQFASTVSGQDIYQTPIDSVKILGMTVSINANYEPTVKEIRSEYQWRQMKSYKTFQTNWPSHYFVLGNDAIQLYPTPSSAYTNGIRYYYQPQDHDLSVEDVTSTSTGKTVTVTNGSTTVTASGSAFNTDMVGLQFQVTGITDSSWYEIVAATTTVLTLKSKYVATTAAGASWKVGQLSIIPQEYADAPIHYALWNFFSAQGNESRAKFHKDTFDNFVLECEQQYSSSNESSVITDDDLYINPWMVPPIPAP